MQKYEVNIPEEKFNIIKFNQEGFIGFAEINKNLKSFEPKIVFGWHCSIMIQLVEVNPEELPTKEELEILDQIQNLLDEKIKGIDKVKPNALFLGRIEWNKTCELIWRVYSPEIVNNFLKASTSEENPIRLFDYRIDPDKSWKLAQWHLNNC